jgi:hypothetical protein
VALDVAITQPLQTAFKAGASTTAGFAAEQYGLRQKIHKYAVKVNGRNVLKDHQDVLMKPIVFETFGTCNADAQQLIDIIANGWSVLAHISVTKARERVENQVSLALQRMNAVMVLDRRGDEGTPLLWEHLSPPVKVDTDEQDEDPSSVSETSTLPASPQQQPPEVDVISGGLGVDASSSPELYDEPLPSDDDVAGAVDENAADAGDAKGVPTCAALRRDRRLVDENCRTLSEQADRLLNHAPAVGDDERRSLLMTRLAIQSHIQVAAINRCNVLHTGVDRIASLSNSHFNVHRRRGGNLNDMAAEGIGRCHDRTRDATNAIREIAQLTHICPTEIETLSHYHDGFAKDVNEAQEGVGRFMVALERVDNSMPEPRSVERSPLPLPDQASRVVVLSRELDRSRRVGSSAVGLFVAALEKLGVAVPPSPPQQGPPKVASGVAGQQPPSIDRDDDEDDDADSNSDDDDDENDDSNISNSSNNINNINNSKCDLHGATTTIFRNGVAGQQALAFDRDDDEEKGDDDANSNNINNNNNNNENVRSLNGDFHGATTTTFRNGAAGRPPISIDEDDVVTVLQGSDCPVDATTTNNPNGVAGRSQPQDGIR